MKRLTKNNKCKLSHGEEIVICNHSQNDCNDSCMKIIPCKWYIKAMNKLKRYEDLEEQGRLLKLPCKVGDTLYRVNKGAKEPVIMMRVLQLYIKQLHKDRTAIKIIAINDDDMGESCYFLEDIGKTVFLTKSEAEAKLEELRGGEND